MLRVSPLTRPAGMMNPRFGTHVERDESRRIRFPNSSVRLIPTYQDLLDETLGWIVAEDPELASAPKAEQSRVVQQTLAEMGTPDEATFLAQREQDIHSHVEPPCIPLVRKLLLEGKWPYSSNAYGPGPQGVKWHSKNNRQKGFEPL